MSSEEGYQVLTEKASATEQNVRQPNNRQIALGHNQILRYAGFGDETDIGKGRPRNQSRHLIGILANAHQAVPGWSTSAANPGEYATHNHLGSEIHGGRRWHGTELGLPIGQIMNHKGLSRYNGGGKG